MTAGPDDFVRAYTEALDAYLQDAGEAALSRAYELGRRALGEALGVVELASVHHDAVAALARTLGWDKARVAEQAEGFLWESLSPFEMTFRAFQESNAELQRLNRALLQQKESLEAANQDLEAFSYSASHDLRAPARRIGGLATLLLASQAERLDEPGRRTLRLIDESATRMSRVVEDLLRLARMGRGGVDRTSVDLGAIAREVVERLRAGEPDRRVDVVVPPAVMAQADAGLIAVALENLLGNAWKFTCRTPEPRIEVGQQREDGRTIYFVRDNGAGFPEGGAARLFRAFHRLHSEREFEGTGIGLVTVQRVVRRHGGEIWAEGAPGRGATFSFTLGDGGAR